MPYEPSLRQHGQDILRAGVTQILLTLKFIATYKRAKQPAQLGILRFEQAKFGNICRYHASNRCGLCLIDDPLVDEERHPGVPLMGGIGS